MQMSSKIYYRNKKEGKGWFPWKENEYKSPRQNGPEDSCLTARPGLGCAMA